MAICDARYGDATCDRAPGHTGMHCGTSHAKWYDGETPDPDPRDAEIARLRGIVRDVSVRDPWTGRGGLVGKTRWVCLHCDTVIAKPYDELTASDHASTCAWRRAREAMEGR